MSQSNGSSSSSTRKPVLRLIVTHKRPHLDELVAILLVRRFGMRRWFFPKNQPPEVQFLEESEAARLADRDDVVLIGIGGGEFDEHRPEGRLENVCATDLVARHLGIERWIELREILDEVRRADTQPGQKAFELGQLIKDAYAYGRATPGQMLEVVQLFVPAKYLRQVEFHQTCKKEFGARGRLIECGGIPVAFVESDLESMNGHCRRVQRAELVVIRNSPGRILVFSDNRSERARAAIPWIARAIIAAEGPKLGLSEAFVQGALDRMADCVLNGRGIELPGVPHWYWHVEAGALLNGSKTHEEPRPTLLTLDDMVDVVEAAIEKMAEQGG